MTHKEQKRFIRELCKNIMKSLLDGVPKHPTNWDGHELRKLIAERAALADFGDLMKRGKRLKEYRNEVLVRNIL